MRHELKFYMDYDAEADGKVLLNENDVETIVVLSKGIDISAGKVMESLHEVKEYFESL